MTSSRTIALIQQANLAKAGIKTQLQAYGSAFFDILGKKDWDFIVETPPGNDTPGQQLRTQHSDSWSPIYTRLRPLRQDPRRA